MNNSNKLFKKIDTAFENEYSFVIYTEPIPKARPRFTKQGYTYTPTRTMNYEQIIAASWLYTHKKMFSGDISMQIKFFMPIPKGMSKDDREKAKLGTLRPSKRNGDIDNLTKAVMDGLNNVAFEDDKQIVELIASKLYGEVPRVEIIITEL